MLSESVGKILEQYGDEGDKELAKFILLADQFFDMMNVRSKSEAGRKRKPACEPFRSPNDSRFKVIFKSLTYEIYHLDCRMELGLYFSVSSVPT